MRFFILSFIFVFIFLSGSFYVFANINFDKSKKIGDVLDSFNGVEVYFNGAFNSVHGRNLTKDGYNLGLKYQCVEFVKRYYYQKFNHKMPDTYGHAKDFFDKKIKDGNFNSSRGMFQFTNPSLKPPRVEDIIVFGPTLLNPYGHIAIVSDIKNDYIEVVQQNTKNTRKILKILKIDQIYKIDDENILGWLSIDFN